MWFLIPDLKFLKRFTIIVILFFSSKHILRYPADKMQNVFDYQMTTAVKCKCSQNLLINMRKSLMNFSKVFYKSIIFQQITKRVFNHSVFTIWFTVYSWKPRRRDRPEPFRLGNNVWKSTGTTWRDYWSINYQVPTSSYHSHWFSNIISPSRRPVGSVINSIGS